VQLPERYIVLGSVSCRLEPEGNCAFPFPIGDITHAFVAEVSHVRVCALAALAGASGSNNNFTLKFTATAGTIEKTGQAAPGECLLPSPHCAR
jgi:hypothetical protein